MPKASASLARMPGPQALLVSPAGAAGVPLAAFSLTGSSPDPATPGLGLTWLGGDFGREYWNTPATVQSGRHVHGWWRSGSGMMMVASACSDPVENDPEAVVHEVYESLIRLVREAGYPELLRIWNYLPAINRGDGHSERYRRFCMGRARALSECGLDDAAMCAATAIGTRDNTLRVFALASKRAGWSFENPRQVSAWRYPEQYGPKSPAFARATAIGLVDGGKGLLISGTASVIGHATAHPGNVLAQTVEAARNVEALLVQAAERLDDGSLGHFSTDSLVRVYVRHPGDWPAIEARLRCRWPGVSLAGVQGDICRRDLLVEIEAWHRA